MGKSLSLPPSLLIKGSEIFSLEIKSPIMIIVYVATIVPMFIAVLYFRAKGRRGQAKVVVAVLVAVLLLVVGLQFFLVNRSLYYGAWINGTTIHVRYYDDDVFSANVCEANLSIVSVKSALNLLSIRTNGIADPTSGLYMGHYKLNNGDKGDVIVISSRSTKAIIIKVKGEEAIVGLPGAQNFYNYVISLKEKRCH